MAIRIYQIQSLLHAFQSNSLIFTLGFGLFIVDTTELYFIIFYRNRNVYRTFVLITYTVFERISNKTYKQ